MHHPAFPPPKTPLSPRLGSPPFRALPPTAFCTATADGESLSLVNLGGLNSPAAVKEKILARLRIPDDEYFDCVFHLTHIGAGEGRRITDNELWDVCARSGNDRAGVTIFVKRSITFDPESDYAGASSAARLRSQGEDARSLRSASSHHPPVPPAQSMQQSLSAEPRHRPNLPSPSNSSSSIPFMRSPVPPQQNPNRQPPTPPVDPRVHPQYAVVPPSSQYHNLYIQSQYQSHPPPNIRTQTASSAHHMQSFSPVPPRQLMSKSVGNLHGQYTTQDSRPPLPTSGSNSQYRQHDHQSPQSGYPGAYGSRQPPQQPPYPQPPPRQQQTSPRPPTYNPPPPSNQAYPSFDPRVMRAPPSASSSSSRSGPPSSTAPSSSYSPYPSHIPPRSIPTNIPPPSTQFWPGPPPQRPSDRTIRPPEISGRISLRPGEMLQHSGRRASEGQPESIAINSALSRSPPVAAHMRAADPAQEARKRSNANFEAEPGRYATESVPAPRRESSEVRSTMERPSPERSRSKEAATRKRIDGAPPPKVVTNGLGGREGEHAAGNGISGPASASARSSGSSFASNSSTQSFPRRKSAPSDEVYGGMTDDIVSLRTASSTRSSTNSASGPLTPLTPLTDYLSPVLPMTKSPPPSTSALDGLGIEEAKSMPVEIDFGDEEDDTGTWQAGKVPSPYIDSFDEDVEEEGAGTWLVTPKETPSTPSTATLPLKVGGITLKDEPSSRSPTTERNRKEQRPSLRLTIDNSSEISDAAAAVTPRSNGRKSADSDHSTATSSRRIDRARLSPAAAAVVPTPTRPGSLSSIGVGPPPMLRRGTSFARREADSEWAFRPPIETVLENLDEYFPEHDLDQPIVDANTPPTAMRSPAASSPARKDALAESARQGAVTALRNKKTIRKVAQERKRNLQMQKLGNVEEAAAPDLSLLRRKSTKLWGNRVEEVTPEQAKLMSTVITAAPDDDPENCQSFSPLALTSRLISRRSLVQMGQRRIDRSRNVRTSLPRDERHDGRYARGQASRAAENSLRSR